MKFIVELKDDSLETFYTAQQRMRHMIDMPGICEYKIANKFTITRITDEES